VLVGSAERIADELIGWAEDTGVDGFNLAYAISPESFVDFVDLVVPELQRRGVFKREYAAGTLREKLYGEGRSHLDSTHPGSRFRHASEPRAAAPPLPSGDATSPVAVAEATSAPAGVAVAAALQQ
jgi:alkanesulfonate monooxygenase